jgi:hypothetical protein
MGLELKQKKKFLKERKWPPREPVMRLGLLARSKQRLINIYSYLIGWDK